MRLCRLSAGNDRKNCFVYRTIEDLDAIRAASLNAKSGVVIRRSITWFRSCQSLTRLKPRKRMW